MLGSFKKFRWESSGARRLDVRALEFTLNIGIAWKNGTHDSTESISTSSERTASAARRGIYDVKQLDRGLTDPIKDPLDAAWIKSAARTGPYSSLIERPRDCT